MEVSKELEIYSTAISSLAISKSGLIFPNSSPQHAAIVLSAIIRHANSEVRIYDDCLDGEVADLSDSVCDSIVELLNKSSKSLKMVLRDDSSHDSKIYRLLSSFSLTEKKRLDVRKASPDFQAEVKRIYSKDINFAVGDLMSFRMEKVEGDHKDKSRREAICSFNRQEYAKKLAEIFDLQFDSCKKVQFVTV